MATYQVTCVYVVDAPCKGIALSQVHDPFTAAGDLLDFVSVRELTPDERRESIPRQLLREAKGQLLGRAEPTQQPAVKNGHA